MLIARQSHAGSVTAHHVGLAAAALGVKGGGTSLKRLSDMGMLLAGAGLGYLGNVVLAGEYTFTNAAICFIPLMLGLCLYAYVVGRE